MIELIKIKKFALGPIQTNCYVVSDSKTNEGILVDPASYEREVVRYISDNNISIKHTVNTHGHYDHIAGNDKYGFPVLIHEKDAECLSNPAKNFSFVMGYTLKVGQAKRTLKDSDKIKINNLEFEIIHLPGHTPGGIGLKVDDMLFSGDTLFFESIGRTDIPRANSNDLKKSLQKLMKLDDKVKVFPGHGPETTIGHERRNNPHI